MHIKKILYSSRFLRALKSCKGVDKEVVQQRSMMFQKDCFAARLKTHKLKGKYKDLWSFSITDTHRIIFRLYKDGTAEFITVGDHDIYR